MADDNNITMNKNEVVRKINDFLVDEFEVDEGEISPNANLKETLDLDSLDYVDLVAVIENHFGFKVQNEDFRNINTFQDFYDYIINKVNAN
jgi:acyl carrier protein